MHRFIQTYSRPIIACIIIVVLLLMPFAQARAGYGATFLKLVGLSNPVTAPISIFSTLAGWGSTDSACDLSLKFSLSRCFLEILTEARTEVATVIEAVISLFINVLHMGLALDQVLFVHQAWQQLLNLVDLAFIIMIIIMAFGTIFSIPRYTYKDLLAHLIIAALLINFSFVIGTTVIQVGSGFATVFLKQIDASDQKPHAFADALGKGFGLATFAAPADKSSSQALDTTGQATALINNQQSSSDNSQAIFTEIIRALFFLAFGLIALFSLIAALLFSIARIPILWLILILSPVAWLGYIIPSLKKQTWSHWWSALMSWSFFLPVYLFFLVMAFAFLQQSDNLANNLRSMDPVILNNQTLIGLNTVFLYIVTIAFLIGGLWASRKIGVFSGDGVNKLFSKIEGGLKTAGRGTAQGVYRLTGARDLVAGAKQGWNARWAELKKYGTGEGGLGLTREGWFGSQRTERQQAKWASRVWGGEQYNETQAKQIQESKTELEKKVKTKDDWDREMESGDKIKRQALLQLQAENGWLTTADQQNVLETLKQLGGANTKAGREYISALVKGDFEHMFAGPEQKKAFIDQLQGPEFLALKKSMLQKMAKDKEIFDEQTFETTANLFANDAKEIRDKVMADLQKNVTNTYKLDTPGSALGYLKEKDVSPLAKRLIAQEMAEKKKIKTFEDYKAVMDILDPNREGGFLSQEIREKVRAFNPLLELEDEIRRINNRPTGSVDGLMKKRVEGILNKSVEDLSKYNADFYSHDLVQNAFRDGLENAAQGKESRFDGEFLADLNKKLQPKARAQVKKVINEHKQRQEEAEAEQARLAQEQAEQDAKQKAQEEAVQKAAEEQRMNPPGPWDQP